MQTSQTVKPILTLVQQTADIPPEFPKTLMSTKLVMPEHLNPHGTLFGGQMMAWMDLVGAMLGSRVTKGKVVTKKVSEISFVCPAFCGDQVQLDAYLVKVGKTSMEIIVDAFIIPISSEATDEKKLTASASFTFVHVDENGNKKEIQR